MDRADIKVAAQAILQCVDEVLKAGRNAHWKTTTLDQIEVILKNIEGGDLIVTREFGKKPETYTPSAGRSILCRQLLPLTCEYELSTILRNLKQACEIRAKEGADWSLQITALDRATDELKQIENVRDRKQNTIQGEPTCQ